MNIPAWIIQFIIYIVNMFDKISAYILDFIAYPPHSYYMFVENDFVPYPYELSYTEGDEPYMLYDIKERAFIPWVSGRSVKDIISKDKRTPLPVLSLTINYSDEMMYDLTDFIENMRVFHINGIIPAVAHIISIWQIHSGVTLDEGLYDVHYLDTMGNEHVTDIRCLKNLGAE
jgi:hypothetical protein